MISMGDRGRGARLGRRVCDHVIMPGAVIGVAVGVTRAVIGVCVIGGLRMIMLVLGTLLVPRVDRRCVLEPTGRHSDIRSPAPSRPAPRPRFGMGHR